MKTKNLIKTKAIQLFNELGVVNVTLREVANHLDRSYGNITYHFPSKEDLLLAIFEDMNEELMSLSLATIPKNDLLKYFLKLPEYSFDITLKYLFFNQDFLEIKRHYPSLFAKSQQLNKIRKDKWLSLLIELREDGFLKDSLENDDLEYIILISTSVRLFYFQSLDYKMYDKISFSNYVNRLLKPYLSKKGLEIYLLSES